MYPYMARMNPEFIGRVLEKIASRATAFSTDEEDQLGFWKHPIYWCEYFIILAEYYLKILKVF